MELVQWHYLFICFNALADAFRVTSRAPQLSNTTFRGSIFPSKSRHFLLVGYRTSLAWCFRDFANAPSIQSGRPSVRSNALIRSISGYPEIEPPCQIRFLFTDAYIYLNILKLSKHIKLSANRNCILKYILVNCNAIFCYSPFKRRCSTLIYIYIFIAFRLWNSGQLTRDYCSGHNSDTYR